MIRSCSAPELPLLNSFIASPRAYVGLSFATPFMSIGGVDTGLMKCQFQHVELANADCENKQAQPAKKIFFNRDTVSVLHEIVAIVHFSNLPSYWMYSWPITTL